ncbi:MAG: hypothetical protein FWC21_01180 [Treponema sp.]|nr:hypothetical protein [Treponema sp.]
METAEYITTLDQILINRKDWLERNELTKLKDNLRIYQISYASLYNIFLKKKLIDEDPYKQETKISELEIPDSGNFPENERIKQLTIRLSNYDSQLDFLVNFYQLGVDFLNLDRIKRIVGLIRYIDWVSFSPDSQSIMTKFASDLTNQSKMGVDTMTLSIIGESLSRLSKTTTASMATLKELNVFYRESYKLNIRKSITQGMSAGEATPESIRKKMPSALPGTPFYKELIEELIREDNSKEGSDLRDNILNSLMVKEEKSKVVKQAIDFKKILLDGIVVIGGASNSLTDIIGKLVDNQAALDSRKKGFFEAIKELIRQITNAEPEEIIYTIEKMDEAKGVPIKEKINFRQFIGDIEKKNKILASFVRGPAYNKLSAMSEEQIINYLERNIKEMTTLHKTLNALDDFFKSSATSEDRDKIKGIKPELSALKNTYVKANQLRYDYSAQKEEEEQMKNLGIKLNADAPPPVPLPPQ